MFCCFDQRAYVNRQIAHSPDVVALAAYQSEPIAHFVPHALSSATLQVKQLLTSPLRSLLPNTLVCIPQSHRHNHFADALLNRLAKSRSTFSTTVRRP
jgi:hypothetical protein